MQQMVPGRQSVAAAQARAPMLSVSKVYLEHDHALLIRNKRKRGTPAAA